MEDVSDDDEDVGQLAERITLQPDAGDTMSSEDEDHAIEPNLPAVTVGGSSTPKKRRRSTAGDAAQAGRRVPIKLRLEAEPEKMVDKIPTRVSRGSLLEKYQGYLQIFYMSCGE